MRILILLFATSGMARDACSGVANLRRFGSQEVEKVHCIHCTCLSQKLPTAQQVETGVFRDFDRADFSRRCLRP